MPKVTDGYYEPKSRVKATHWPTPDADGDGEEVWEVDDEGYRNVKRDKDGEEVHHYLPPEGFINVPSYDGTPNYVRTDERRRPRYDRHGHVSSIKPGTVLLEYSDGTSKLLEDDYSVREFLASHEYADATDNEVPGQPTPTPKKATPAKVTTPDKKTPPKAE